MISAEIVTHTWQRMAQTPIDAVPELIDLMSSEQPVVLGYLFALEDMPFDRNERETIFYIGMVVWQIMRQSSRRLRKVTRRKLEQAEEANYGMLEDWMGITEDAMTVRTASLLDAYPEPEVLRYIAEAVMEESEDPEEPGFRDEYKGLAFVHLKIVLDAFIRSLPPRARLVA
jgi:hypothetical protein